MASQYYTRSHDEPTLALLEQAFADTWIRLRDRDPFRDWDKDSQLKTNLTDELKGLVDEGITDPSVLSRLALESFPPRL